MHYQDFHYNDETIPKWRNIPKDFSLVENEETFPHNDAKGTLGDLSSGMDPFLFESHYEEEEDEEDSPSIQDSFWLYLKGFEAQRKRQAERHFYWL